MDSFVENDKILDDIVPDAELEKMRTSALETERTDYQQVAKILSSRVEHVHSSYLFVAQGLDILREMCKLISSTPGTINYVSWKDLASALGLDFNEIGCIENYRQDYTLLVLLTFAQSPDASLSKLVSAFQQIERYDALMIADKHFPGLCRIAEVQHEKVIPYSEDERAAYHKLEDSDTGKSDRLLTPPGFKFLKNQLPFTLKKEIRQDTTPPKETVKQVFTAQDLGAAENLIRRIEVLTCASSHIEPQLQPTKNSNLCKKAMLTFARDGDSVAAKVSEIFRRNHNSLGRIGVLILNDHAEKVLENPHRFIVHQFAKMDYIIPILTEGYFDSLCNETDSATLNISDHLDSKYIQLIHNLMCNYYTENNCSNEKIRCIVPKGSRALTHPHFAKDPVFKVYCYDDSKEIEKLALRLAKVSQKRK